MRYDLYLSLVDFQTGLTGSCNDSFLVGNYKSLDVLFNIYITVINSNLFKPFFRCAGTGFRLW